MLATSVASAGRARALLIYLRFLDLTEAAFIDLSALFANSTCGILLACRAVLRWPPRLYGDAEPSVVASPVGAP